MMFTNYIREYQKVRDNDKIVEFTTFTNNNCLQILNKHRK